MSHVIKVLLLGVGNQQTIEQKWGKPKKRGWKFWVKFWLVVLAGVVVLWFIDENIIIDGLAGLLALGLPILTILIIISPFLYIYQKKIKLNVYNFISALIVSAFFTALLYKLWELLAFFVLTKVGEAFLSTF